MEAGLPVLVSKEFEYMYKWVEEHGVGKGIVFSEMADIKKVIEKLELDKMRKNISKKLSDFSLENQIPKLIEK